MDINSFFTIQTDRLSEKRVQAFTITSGGISVGVEVENCEVKRSFDKRRKGSVKLRVEVQVEKCVCERD
jgi:hypothetical protein